MTTVTDVPLVQPERRAGYVWDTARRLRANRVAMLAGGAVLLLILVAIFADLIAPHGTSEQFLQTPTETTDDPLASRDTGKFEGPSLDHPFGTDQLARDILSRVVVGLRLSLGAAFFAIVVVTLIGIAVGAAAAMGPPIVDDILMRVTDIAFAFPALLLIILLRAAFGNTLFGLERVAGIDMQILLLFMAIALTAWPTTARLVRGQFVSLREADYTLAARALGATPWRIAWRHLLPNSSSVLIVDATFLVPRAILAEATLSFIGVGVQPPTPSLGLLINQHFGFVGVQWTGLAIPSLILAALFLAFQLFGDGLRDALDPRTRRF